MKPPHYVVKHLYGWVQLQNQDKTPQTSPPVSTGIHYKHKKKEWRRLQADRAIWQMSPCVRAKCEKIQEKPGGEVLAPVSVATCLSGDSARCDEARADYAEGPGVNTMTHLLCSPPPPPPPPSSLFILTHAMRELTPWLTPRFTEA